MKIYIYRPDMAKIRPDLLYTPRGKPYYESRQDDREIRAKIEDLRDALRWQKLNKPRRKRC